MSRRRDELIVGPTDIYFDCRVFDEVEFVIAERDEDALLVDGLCLVLERKSIAAMKNVLVQDVQVRVVSNRRVDQRTSI